MLFSDLKGYSKIKNDSLKEKVYEVNQKIQQTILNKDNHFYCNTWGDAFFICGYDCYELAEVALKIRDEIRNTSWERQGFEEDLKIRIGLHTQIVRVIETNNVVVEVIGAGIDKAARIEPIVHENEVFCSSSSFTHILLEKFRKINGESLGSRKLAKDFGETELYKLNWKSEEENDLDKFEHKYPLPRGQRVIVKIRQGVSSFFKKNVKNILISKEQTRIEKILKRQHEIFIFKLPDYVNLMFKQKIKTIIDKHLLENHPKVLLNFENVELVNSHGAASFLYLYSFVHELGGVFSLCCIKEKMVEDMMRDIGLLFLVGKNIYKTENEAINSLKKLTKTDNE